MIGHPLDVVPLLSQGELLRAIGILLFAILKLHTKRLIGMMKEGITPWYFALNFRDMGLIALIFFLRIFKIFSEILVFFRIFFF